MKSVYEIALFTVLMLFATAARAGFGDGKSQGSANESPDPMVATVHLQPATVEAGGTANLTIDIILDEGYHAYLERFKLAIESPDDLKLDQFKIKPTVSFNDKISKSVKQGVSGKATLTTVMEVPKGFKAGHYPVKLHLTYQACREEFCLFPKTQNLEVGLTIN